MVYLKSLIDGHRLFHSKHPAAGLSNTLRTLGAEESVHAPPHNTRIIAVIGNLKKVNCAFK